ncbi:MAG: hypothetical protein KF819_22490 [Labilithrix sp.]|nr:hypothetical protein [Labilithrix sp.]
MRRLVLSACLVSACHLADDKDPPKCEPGTHVENDRCVLDAFSGPVVTLAAHAGGTVCDGPTTERPPTITPETINVKVNGDFRFKNDDAMEHEVRGADGQVWLKVKPGELSGIFGISKAGAWAYRVSGCLKGGSVVVE